MYLKFTSQPSHDSCGGILLPSVWLYILRKHYYSGQVFSRFVLESTALSDGF